MKKLISITILFLMFLGANAQQQGNYHNPTRTTQTKKYSGFDHDYEQQNWTFYENPKYYAEAIKWLTSKKWHKSAGEDYYNLDKSEKIKYGFYSQELGFGIHIYHQGAPYYVRIDSTKFGVRELYTEYKTSVKPDTLMAVIVKQIEAKSTIEMLNDSILILFQKIKQDSLLLRVDFDTLSKPSRNKNFLVPLQSKDTRLYKERSKNSQIIWDPTDMGTLCLQGFVSKRKKDRIWYNVFVEKDKVTYIKKTTKYWGHIRFWETRKDLHDYVNSYTNEVEMILGLMIEKMNHVIHNARG